MGKTEWFIPDMYWAEEDHGSYVSHEAICVLNTHDEDCIVDITLYFEDREPVKCQQTICPARRTNHIRTDHLLLADGRSIPRGVGYAGYIKCSVPVIIQYTRVDTTQEPLALMSTIAF